RREREDQDVLGGDVADVLHARQARLQEREAGLHEHHEHRCDHYPDGAGGVEELLVAHAATSTASSGPPVRLCITDPIAVVHTIPSPASLPLRAASTPASTTAGAFSSVVTKISCAFGRKRDSKMRPRYSWVIPRWRPWPTASITVTPTWPAS